MASRETPVSLPELVGARARLVDAEGRDVGQLTITRSPDVALTTAVAMEVGLAWQDGRFEVLLDRPPYPVLTQLLAGRLDHHEHGSLGVRWQG